MDRNTTFEDRLNEEQLDAYGRCVHGNKSVLVTGPGGTGKSVLIPMIVAKLREKYPEKHSHVVVTASTGSAAYLVGGSTLHSFAGIGIEEENTTLMVNRARRRSRQWKQVKVLIIDEISMISGRLFENLSYVAQRIRNNNETFGGIRILMFGDFLQIPPVSNSDKLVFETDIWREMNPDIVLLQKDMRQVNQEFAQILSRIRLGQCTDDDADYIRSLERPIKYDDGVDPVMLYALRAEANSYNNTKMQQLTGEEMTFKSIDKGYMNSLSQCPSPDVITLKVGAQVMLNRNLSNMAVNGSIGTVVAFESIQGLVHNTRYPVVSMILSNGERQEMHISPVEWKVETSDGDVIASRIQLPLILSWAITIHKSQGKTIPRVWIDMKGIFQQNQAYVALSRCTDPNNLQVVNFEKGVVDCDQACKEFYCILEAKAHHAKEATNVASATDERTSIQEAPWATSQADTLVMMGELTLDDTRQPSSLDSERL